MLLNSFKNLLSSLWGKIFVHGDLLDFLSVIFIGFDKWGLDDSHSFNYILGY